MTSLPTECLFTSLPFDLLVHIQAYCTIQDLLMLRCCSKRLEEVSRTRAIWIQALQELSAQLYLYPHTFPVNSMSAHQLELCATAHFRIHQQVLYGPGPGPCSGSGSGSGSTTTTATSGDHSDPDLLRPAPMVQSTTSFSFPLSPPSPQVLLFQCLALAPGGRYLFFHFLTHLELWDLHPIPLHHGSGISSYSHTSALEPIRIASIDHPLQPLQLILYKFEVSLSHCGSSLIVHLMGLELDTAKTWLSVYRIDPAAPNSTFELVGYLNTDLFDPTGDTFHFNPVDLTAVFITDGGSSMWVWSTTSRLLVKWSEGADHPTRWTDHVFICDKKIIGLTMDQYLACVYTLPNLEQLEQRQQQHLQTSSGAVLLSTDPRYVEIVPPLVDVFHYNGDFPFHMLGSPSRPTIPVWASDAYQRMDKSLRLDLILLPAHVYHGPDDSEPTNMSSITSTAKLEFVPCEKEDTGVSTFRTTTLHRDSYESEAFDPYFIVRPNAVTFPKSNHRLLWWFDRKGLRLNASFLGDDDDPVQGQRRKKKRGNAVSRAVYIPPSINSGMGRFTTAFDPVVGRICSLSLDRHTVHVIDLAPGVLN